MKNKSTHHKETNTFKFQPFSERIANINIDIFHRVPHENELEEDDNECFFYQAIQKWNVLNLTESYNSFKKEVQPHTIVTLPQLLLSKDNVIEVLLKHLSHKDILCLQPLLEFVVALAKDLRKEFYPYYPQFLNTLIELLNSKDVEQLDWTFTCLAYLFKFLWRPLINDIVNVLKILLPLLSDSKPEYVNNFAAESFAFVVRKIRDKKAFLKLLLSAVKRNDNSIKGCGKLLFESINGVDGQFHNCADVMVPFLYESLIDADLPQDILFEILEEVTTNITSTILPEKGEVLNRVLIAMLNTQSKMWNENHLSNLEHNIKLILLLFGQMVEFKSGKFVRNPSPLLLELKLLLSYSDISETVLLTIIKLAIVLLLSRNIQLPQDQAGGLTKKILCSNNKQALLFFIENISSYGGFEASILPAFLKYAHNSLLEADYLHVLTKLILKKSPLCDNGIKLKEWKKYEINFGSKSFNLDVQSILKNHICIDTADQIWKNIENYLCTLICLPHLNLNGDEITKQLERNIKLFCDLLLNLENSRSDDEIKKLFFLLSTTLECVIHLGCNLIDKYDLIVNATLPFADKHSFLSALKILDLYISTCSKEDISLERLMKIHIVLEKNFNSPYHEMRLLTSHIYTCFEVLPDFQKFKNWNVFSLCFQVESIVPQVHTYRDQLQCLEKLNYDKEQMTFCKETDFKTIPLRYFCGVLHMRFKLLWDPAIALITSHASGLDINIFWNVFLPELKKCADYIQNPLNHDQSSLQTSCDFLNSLYEDSYKIDAKEDFYNYRILLWKAMSNFPDIAEAKTRDTSDILLNFIEKEYATSNSENALICNIKEYENMDNNEAVNEKCDERPDKVATSGKKNNILSLLGHLKVFAKIKSPKSMYREADLNKLYFNFLSHKNCEIQKVALDCIFTYKYKYLTPYQSNLYKLIDDKNFKNELSSFQVDKESNVIKEEHRDDLMPIVMQIVFSKMFAKTGLRTGGKSSGQFRRMLVLKFLAGCPEKELLSFIHMAFKYYSAYIEENTEDMIKNISGNINLEKFIPPKKLQSTANLISVIFDQFGGLMGNELLKYLLKIILIVGATLKGALEQSSNIHSGYNKSLREVRNSSIKIVEKFYRHFESYPWSQMEINAVFEVYVFPYLSKLNIEGIHSPTALLKLFVLWGSVPRYFCLLIKHDIEDVNQYALSHIMQLLLNPKSHISVSNMIMEMIEKLIRFQADEEDPKNVIPVENALPIRKDILERLKLNEKLNYGSCILLPFVTSILEKIKMRLQNERKNVNKRELYILSRISEMVWESDICDAVLDLLLPIVLKKCYFGIDEEVSLQFLTTICNLLHNTNNPAKHLKKLSILFGEVNYPSSRKMLCQILEQIAKKCDLSIAETLQLATTVINELNAWDAKWIDQPDYRRRLDAFKVIQKLENKDVSLELGSLLLYNCYHQIKFEKDLSLRESASYCMKHVAGVLIENYKNSQKELSYILDDTLLLLIKNGLKNENNDLRNEMISFLGHLSREVPEAHVVLRDLNKVSSKTDLEVDFFENLIHLQLHRHSRALLKFCRIFKNEPTLPNTKTLIQFVLPLTSHYLCTEKFAKKNSVIDSAIETIGVICRLLPWHQYESLLKFYIGKLRHEIDFQHQLVRLVVVILDSFHFDLSKAEYVKEKVESEVNNLKKEENILKVTSKDIDNDIDDKEVENEIESENIEDIEENTDDVNENIEIQQINSYEKITILCKSTATRVVKTIQMVLLPQLHQTLMEMTHHENSHKSNRKRTGEQRETEDLLRVPISLALVKLLQKLPVDILQSNLPGVFMKLCTFLKSPLESVRRAAREILQKIMLALGPEYLGFLLGEILPLMSRGYQVHVLVYTVHSLLVTLKDMFQPGDVDKVLLTILQLCKQDLFGNVAEEKEVLKIIHKISEAKSTKSFDTFQILAQSITDKCLIDLISPIKIVLQATHSHKMLTKAQECLRFIAIGLVSNQFIQLETLLKFAYGVSSESIPELLGQDKTKVNVKKIEKEDCMIIPKEPVYKSGYRVSGIKTSLKTNSHILIEFGIRLCYFILKKDMLKVTDYKSFMDPFVVLFKNCLISKHVKLSTITLQCLAWILKYDLPSLKVHIKEMVESIFSILHKYAASGLSKGDNFDLVVAAFKTTAVLVRNVKYYTVDTDQLKILLLYAEQDLYDHDRQATAFGLLKAIISSKLDIKEIHDIMEKVAELSITSELPHVRLQCRIVFHQFLMDYPLGKKLDRHIAFYLAQLRYHMEFGRQSALEMIQSFINSFPYNILKNNSGLFLITLGARLMTDDSAECKKMIANCLKLMFGKLSKPDLDTLFEIIILWLEDKKVGVKQIGAQICGFLITTENSAFESRIDLLTPVIFTQFGLNESGRKPGQFVLLNKEEDENSEKERNKDHHLYLVLLMLMKLSTRCPSFLKRTEYINQLATHIQTLLAHPHEWVRLGAAQFLGFVLSSLNSDKLGELLAENKSDETGGYLYGDPQNMIKSLTLDLWVQLQPNNIKPQMAEQVIKNLVFVARVLQKVPLSTTKTINLLWMAKLMRKIINAEIVEAPSSTVVRNEVFTWIGAVGSALDIHKIKGIINHLLAPLVREMLTTEESNKSLRHLAKEVANMIKNRIGLEEYTEILSKLQLQLSAKRSERKRARAQLAVTEPEIFAKKKIKHHDKKKEAKKRKIADRKEKKTKRRKIPHFDDNSEII